MTLHVFHDDCEWWVAESLEECWELFLKDKGVSRDYYEAYEFEQLPEDKIISILCERDAEGVWRPSDGGEYVEKTAAEWAKQQGKGMLCTTEY